MSSADERAVRTRLADVEIELDARKMYPLSHDLGWNRARIAWLTAEAARLRQLVAVLKVMSA